MAQSRLEKIGTIYSRVSSLLKSGAVKEENTPLWFDIYKAFPPKYEPRYDQTHEKVPLREIFYIEDLLRAKFHKDHQNFSMVNLLDNKSISKTEQFIEIYNEFEKEGVLEDERYEKSINELLKKSPISTKSKKSAQTVTTEGSEESITDKEQYKPVKLSLEALFKDNDEKNDTVEKPK